MVGKIIFFFFFVGNKIIVPSATPTKKFDTKQREQKDVGQDSREPFVEKQRESLMADSHSLDLPYGELQFTDIPDLPVGLVY